MEKIHIATGVVHDVPADLEAVLTGRPELRAKWNDLTPLARNEWICWMTFVQKQKTRDGHLLRLQDEIADGKRRPCCWPGCPHRNENAKKWLKKM